MEYSINSREQNPDFRVWKGKSIVNDNRQAVQAEFESVCKTIAQCNYI